MTRERRRSAEPRPSAGALGLRAASAVALACLGYFGVTHSLALATRGGDPARAHALAPWDGRITARLAESRLTASPAAGAQASTSRLARRALRQDPAAVTAVATLGLQAQVRDDTAEARRLMAYAQRLSRRHLQTQLWAIEDAVAREDVPGALRHYDIALRTSKSAPALLFPVLAAATADPAIRSDLARLLATGPEWGPAFVAHVARKGADPRATAALFISLTRAGVSVPAEATSPVIDGLIARGAVDEAWRYYASVRPGVVRTASRDPRFAAGLTTPSAFDWTPQGSAGVSASIQRSGRGGVFDFSASASSGGVVLQQVQALPPGAYRLEGHASGVEQSERSRPYWTLTCRDGRELGRAAMPNSSQAAGAFEGRFDVPAGCPVQTLSLAVRPSYETSGVAGRIDRVRLTPAR